MASQKFMLAEFAWNERYRLRSSEDVLTPALLIYPDVVAENISATLKLLSGEANRWRVHIKTAKLGFSVGMLVERGVVNFKCATTLELLVACQTGAKDILVAYPLVGANARRVREIADQFPEVRVSALAENEDQIREWRKSRVGIFVDVNPGMNRTGVEQDRRDEVVSLVRAIHSNGLEFRGLHYYDGQYGAISEPERTTAAHSGYDRLLLLVGEIERNEIRVEEVTTAGTPTFPSSLSYRRFGEGRFLHRISPGTIVYSDATCLAQLPIEFGFQPSALVLTRVVSHPRQGMITCDAGHKTVSADAGVPTCLALGHRELSALAPSEEHLPFAVSPGEDSPRVGELLYLLPRHVCPTVNNFDLALIVRAGEVESIEKVSARGREAPLPGPVKRSAHAGV